jgi:hypothetical protein
MYRHIKNNKTSCEIGGNTTNNFYSINTEMNTREEKGETKLINQGTFGCIYYPSLPFQLKKGRNKLTTNNDAEMTSRKSFVSKLQKHNFHSDFEDYIGKRIQEIPSFELFFVPVLHTYRIDLATIKEKYVTDCDAVRRYIPGARSNDTTIRITPHDYRVLNKKFVMQKMKYINGTYLYDYLHELVRTTKNNHDHDHDDDDDHHDDHDDDDDDDDHFSITKSLRKDERQIDKYRTEFKGKDTETTYRAMSIVFDMYERIIDSIQLLIQYKIVHYDIKENNILIEKTQKLPYIIDFGLSIAVGKLLEHKWDETYEKYKGEQRSIDSNVVYSLDSSELFKDNYLWKQHFYVHAPDYYLWPIEVHLMTYLINEHETLTEESLHYICFEFVKHNRAIECMSPHFKKKIYDTSMATFSRYIHKPREQALNELLHYWPKWDMYAVNVMFIRILLELLFSIDYLEPEDTARAANTATDTATNTATYMQSHNEERQHKFDPHYSAETKIEFKSKYKVKLKHRHDNYKLMNTIQVMLRNIHPNPDKRMTPEETKAFLMSVFYYC